ncbi:MAG: hypothetical protein U0104_15155 [Gemmatimonadales bacterium]
MSLTSGQYAFLPWLRTGVGTEIARVDGTAGNEPRVTLPIQVRFNGDPGLAGGLTVELHGPGEVQVVDTLGVLRTWPRPGVMDAEPNYFPLIEFDQADLPWRYTPARATGGDRLTPWITLIVLEDAEIKRLVPGGSGRLGAVEIIDAKVLPRSRQLWAWAHVQVAGEQVVDEARAAALMAARSGAIRSRLVAPRRLEPHRGYTALVVPAFQRGRLTGLGQDPGALDALTLAWGDTPSGPLTLPVYYSWRFGTGPDGDFESLARLLQPFEAPESIGIRDMDVSAASPGFPPANPAPLGLRGMLTALKTPDTAWPAPARLTWIARLKQLLNLPADRAVTPGTERTVVPPLYGQWPAATDRCTADVEPQRPLWFQELAVDPRLRVGAGLGTRVIQEHQEALMASAWDQVDRVRQLNEELRQAQLARELATRLASRHLFKHGPEQVLGLTAPLHARVKASPTTVRAVLNESPVPRGVFEGAFRRLTRPLGPLGRRLGPRPADAGGLLARLNAGLLQAAPPPAPPESLASLPRLGTAIAPAGVTAKTVAAAREDVTLYRRGLWLVLVLAVILALLGGWPLALAGAALAGGFGYLAWQAAARAALAPRVALRDGTLTGDLLRETPPAPSYAPAAAPATGAPPTLPTVPAGAAAPPAGEVIAVREALATMFDRMQPPAEPLRTLAAKDLPALSQTLAMRLEPSRTIAQAFAGRYQLAPGMHFQPADPLEPLLAAPEFPQPMYRPLADLSNEWLLPGFEKIPPNSATLLKTNQKMIEAYMTGLNHEMARELLWREYPTTQRATCFRQFWDTAGYVPPPTGGLTPEQLRDITPIHGWAATSGLGEHSPRPPLPGGGDYLVLFIRGDLLRRYPDTEVYAVRARWGSEGREMDEPANESEIPLKVAHPMFSGFMQPDANFFGFRLTAEEVLGDGVRNGALPGWYFVLAEPSHQPRFGLDVAADTLADAQFGLPVSGGTWNDLGWANLASSRAALGQLTTIDLDAALPDTSGVADPRAWHADQGQGRHGSRASDLAFITLQRPMRLAIHASEMIP